MSKIQRLAVCALCAIGIPNGAQAEILTLVCEPREVAGIHNAYDRPITLTVDLDRRVVGLETPEADKSSTKGLYPTPHGDTIGPLRVEITEKNIAWGAPWWPDRIRYLAEFDGTINRETGAARVRWYDRQRPTVSFEFNGACRRATKRF